MFPEERLNYMLNKINKYGRVNVSDLSKELKVSEVTVRKDLKILEDRNLIKRTFGGAVILKNHVKAASLSDKKVENMDSKKSIAKKAATYLRDGIDIFLDSGTTTFELINSIVKFKDIQVVTFDISIAMELSQYSNVRTHLLGGEIDPATKVSLGLEGVETLSRMHADICFIGTDALDADYVYSTNELKARLKRLMISNSRFRVLICDSSKYGKEGFYSFNRLKDFDEIITDRKNEELNNLLDEVD